MRSSGSSAALSISWPSLSEEIEPIAFFYLSGAAERRGHVSAAHTALVKYLALADDDQKEQLAGHVAELALRMNKAR